MNAVLSEVHDLLQRFAQSEWRDLYVRTARYTLFIAKPGGAVNPLLRAADRQPLPAAVAASAMPVPSDGGRLVTAPHVGTVIAVAILDEPVEPGAVVGRIQVLDDVIEIRSEQGGVVDAVLAPIDTLVQYETPLVRLR